MSVWVVCVVVVMVAVVVVSMLCRFARVLLLALLCGSVILSQAALARLAK